MRVSGLRVWLVLLGLLAAVVGGVLTSVYGGVEGFRELNPVSLYHVIGPGFAVVKPLLVLLLYPLASYGVRYLGVPDLELMLYIGFTVVLLTDAWLNVYAVVMGGAL